MKKRGLLLSLYLFNKLFVVAHNTEAPSLTCLYLNEITAQSSSISPLDNLFLNVIYFVRPMSLSRRNPKTIRSHKLLALTEQLNTWSEDLPSPGFVYCRGDTRAHIATVACRVDDPFIAAAYRRNVKICIWWLYIF